MQKGEIRMSEPIINPMTLYWINVSNSVKTLSVIVSLFTGVVAVCLVSLYIYSVHEYNDKTWSESTREECKQDAALYKTWAIVSTALFSLFLLAALFVPSKQTIIEMNIARLATGENIQTGLDAIKQAADYVINAMKELR